MRLNQKIIIKHLLEKRIYKNNTKIHMKSIYYRKIKKKYNSLDHLYYRDVSKSKVIKRTNEMSYFSSICNGMKCYQKRKIKLFNIK